MAPWNWRNPCTSAATESDESPQTPSPIRNRTHNGFATHQFENSSTDFPISTGNGNIYRSLNSNTTTISTPVLFSTNRGLHLRVVNRRSRTQPATEICSCGGEAISKLDALNTNGLSFVSDTVTNAHTPKIYEIHFCDLERWSTNRANTICLEDTFAVSKRNDSLPSPTMSSANKEKNILNKNYRSSSMFCVPSGSRHALIMPRRSLFQRSTSIQSTFERFGLEERDAN